MNQQRQAGFKREAEVDEMEDIDVILKFTVNLSTAL